jgi:glycerol kinase
MLCNIETCQWDGELEKLLDVPGSVLPQIRSSSEIYGFTTLLDGKTEIPIAGIAGDQQAA